MKKLAIQFNTYDRDGYLYSSRFQFIYKNDIAAEMYRLKQNSTEIVRVEAYDKEENRIIKTYPSKRGGYRPGSGRLRTGRTHPLNVVITEENWRFLESQPNKSAFVDAAIREKIISSSSVTS